MCFKKVICGDMHGVDVESRTRSQDRAIGRPWLAAFLDVVRDVSGSDMEVPTQILLNL